jgi:hypothetical protein
MIAAEQHKTLEQHKSVGRIQGIFLLVLLAILDWINSVLPHLFVHQLLLAHVLCSCNAGYGFTSIFKPDCVFTHLMVMLMLCVHRMQALEMQGKRSEALDELSKICRIHNMFPPEENSVCIWFLFSTWF